MSTVKSADRTLSVLEYLASAPAPRSLAEASADLQVPRSSLHVLLRNLQDRGWLLADDERGITRFRLGPRALTVGSAYLRTDDIVRRSADMLDELSAATKETLHLGLLDGVEVIYLAKREARHNLRLVSGVGVRLPAYATALGKILLSDLPPEDLDRRLALPRQRLTPNTLVDESALRADLDSTRKRGFAVDDNESTEGVRCFAVALGKTPPRTHAISCSIPVARLDAETEASVIKTLQKASAEFEDPLDLLAS